MKAKQLFSLLFNTNDRYSSETCVNINKMDEEEVKMDDWL